MEEVEEPHQDYDRSFELARSEIRDPGPETRGPNCRADSGVE